MHSSSIPDSKAVLPGLLPDGGEMGRRIRSFNWPATPLGSAENWPQSLYSALSICLNSNFPIAIYWGTELVLLYNDAWSPIPGNKHPWALGRPAKEVWPDIWNEIEPLFQEALTTGKATGSKDALLPMKRHGYTEECYFDFTFTPVFGEEGKVEGIFNAVIETTYRVINERRTAVLQQIANSIAAAGSLEEVFEKVNAVLKTNQKDIPFAFIYSLENNGHPVLKASTIDGFTQQSLLRNWPFPAVADSGHSFHVEDVNHYFLQAPEGFWTERPKEAVITPLKASSGSSTGFLVCGLSARRQYDKEYQLFIEAIAGSVSNVLNTIRSLEEERKRTEALAQVDHAKTTFFSNISHEFRTPLTLMLSPLEELIHGGEQLSEKSRLNLEASYRNTLRLQKLVNNLLDFSRIEAGRMQVHFEPVDICALTKDISSSFRSAVEKAGIAFAVNCELQEKTAYVDVDMWEKVVLNLISNAFKYTITGKIEVCLEAHNNNIELSVSDTGVGIPAQEMEKIFERFHRVHNTQGRTQEGTGIGLSLVKELVKLQHGSIRAESTIGKGSVFRVSIPALKNHPAAGKVSLPSSSIQPRQQEALVTEALQWIPNGHVISPHNKNTGLLQTNHTPHEKKPRVLLADDNADMRAYIHRLLNGPYDVEAVTNGEEAYQAALKNKPDLIISDMMMPKLDGFGLLEKLRRNSTTQNIPLIFLSARAGEEAKVEGIEAGADDYLIKPFSAKELMAKVDSTIKITKSRMVTEKNLRNLVLQSPVAITVFKGPLHVIEMANEMVLEILQKTEAELTGRPLSEIFPQIVKQGFDKILDDIYKTGKSFTANEMPVNLIRNGKTEPFYFNFVFKPLKNERGEIERIIHVAVDVTQQVIARKKIEENEQYLGNIIRQVNAGIAQADEEGNFVQANERFCSLTGYSREELLKKNIAGLTHPDDLPCNLTLIQQCLADGKGYFIEKRYIRKDGSVVWVNNSVSLVAGVNGKKLLTAVCIDITASRKQQQQLKENEKQLSSLANAMPQLVWMAESNGTVSYYNDRVAQFTGASKQPDGSWNWQGMLHPDDMQPTADAWNKAVAEGSIYEKEHRVQVKDGSYRWHLSRGLPQKNEEGTVVKWYGTATDIHEQKTTAEKLEQLVSERTAELQRSNDDLQQFAHVASHDLKEPLRKIKTFGSRLNNEFGNQLPEKAKTYVTKMETAAKRMYDMIDGVLLYSSLNAVEQTTENVRLSEVLHHIESDLEVLIQQKNATIAYKNLPTIKGSGILLYQLFYNLINNALKFSEPAETPYIKINAAAVKGRDMKKDLNVKPGTTYLRISIQDNGIGFDSEQSQKIFKTFTRLNAKDKYEGTGLGLALCKKIAERHNGVIYAEGKEGKGATFYVMLPCDDDVNRES